MILILMIITGQKQAAGILSERAFFPGNDHGHPGTNPMDSQQPVRFLSY